MFSARHQTPNTEHDSNEARDRVARSAGFGDPAPGLAGHGADPGLRWSMAALVALRSRRVGSRRRGPSASAVDWVRWGNGELARYRLGPAGMAFDCRPRYLDNSRLRRDGRGSIKIFMPSGWSGPKRWPNSRAGLANATRSISTWCCAGTRSVARSSDPEKVIPQGYWRFHRGRSAERIRLTLAEGCDSLKVRRGKEAMHAARRVGTIDGHGDLATLACR